MATINKEELLQEIKEDLKDFIDIPLETEESKPETAEDNLHDLVQRVIRENINTISERMRLTGRL